MQGTSLVPRGVTRRVRVLTTLVLTGLFAAMSLATGGAASADNNNVPDRSITPLVNCYWTNQDNTITFSVGYRSTNAGTVNVPISSDNRFHPSRSDDRGQPTTFLSGTHNNVFAVTVTTAEIDDGIQWELVDNKVDITAPFTKCAQKPVPEFGNGAVLFFGGGLLVVAMLVIGFGLGRARRAPVTA